MLTVCKCRPNKPIRISSNDAGEGMRPKHLAIQLSRLTPHPCLRLELEQYATEGDLAAYWMLAVDETDGLEGATVLDLGAGNGVLGVACLMLGAEHVTFVEADEDAIVALNANLAVLGEGFTSRSTVLTHRLGVDEADLPQVDLVVTNPPWGTQTAKADRPLLEAAFARAKRAVHVLHHSDAAHLESMGRDEGWEHERLMRTDFRLPAAYLHHTKRSLSTDVTCWRFHRPGDAQLPDAPNS